MTLCKIPKTSCKKSCIMILNLLRLQDFTPECKILDALTSILQDFEANVCKIQVAKIV